jgi:FLVCR family MFS transporter 7
VIDKYGFKASVIIGSAVTAVFATTRFIFADNYTLAMLSQFLLAAGQPFLMNISTKVPANWFPVKERSTAAGILLMAQYIGFIIPLNASPVLVDRWGMGTMLGVYAGVALAAAALALIVPREKPPLAPGPEAPKEDMSLKAMGSLLKNKPYVLVLTLSFISMGLFNTLMTNIEDVLAPRGFSAGQTGLVFTVFVLAGIAGAVAVPLFSDRMGRRIPIFIAGIAAMAPLILGLGFLTGYGLVMTCAATLGVVIMGLAPVLFQHGSEVAYPAKEGVSFGLIMLVGQISGILFVVLFDLIQGGGVSYATPMAVMAVLAAVQIPLTFIMKESDAVKALGRL